MWTLALELLNADVSPTRRLIVASGVPPVHNWSNDTTQAVKECKYIRNNKFRSLKLELKNLLEIVMNHHETDKRKNIGQNFQCHSMHAVTVLMHAAAVFAAVFFGGGGGGGGGGGDGGGGGCDSGHL